MFCRSQGSSARTLEQASRVLFRSRRTLQKKLKFVLKVIVQNEIKAFNVDIKVWSVSFQRQTLNEEGYRAFLRGFLSGEISSGVENVNKKVNKLLTQILFLSTSIDEIENVALE